MFCSFLGLLNLVKQSSVLILLKGFGSSRGENSFGTWNKNKKESSKHEVGGKTPSRPALTSGAYKLRLPRIDSILMFLLPSIRIADLGCEMFGIGLIFTEMLQREDLTVCIFLRRCHISYITLAFASSTAAKPLVPLTLGNAFWWYLNVLLMLWPWGVPFVASQRRHVILLSCILQPSCFPLPIKSTVIPHQPFFVPHKGM